MNGRKIIVLLIVVLVASPLVGVISSEKSRANVAIPYGVSSMGVFIEIEEPEDGTVFHHRNVSIYCVARACCQDRLTYWEWKWRWDNGSHSESGSIDYKTEFEFYINISLYPGWNKVDVMVRSNRDLAARDNITLYYDGPVANANGPYKGRTGIALIFNGFAYGGHKPYHWHWDFGDGNESNERDPLHTYANMGTYKVALTVTDSMGYNDTNYTVAMIDKREGNFTHTVLGEYGTVTWCPHCPPASKALYDIYASGDYPFYYISFIMDKNPIAQQRMKRYFDWYIPMVYFDGGYTSEQRNQETAYRTAIQNSGEKEVHNLDIDVNVTWEGNAKIAVRVTIKNNGDSLYFGYLRAYVTEIVSRWNDQKGNPYHFGFLDYAFNRPIFIHPKGTFTASTIWDGSEQHGNQTYEDITKDNVMVIGAVSHWFPHLKKNPWDEPRPVRYLASYVDQTAAAVPDIGNDERIVSVKDHPNKPFNLAGRKNNADYARNLSATNLGEEAYSLFMERDNQNDDGFTNITVQEAWEMLQCPCDGVQIPIDVRTLKEFLDERIDTPYFYNRPRLFPLQLMYKEFLFHFFMWQHSSEEIILYCRSGKRSFAAAKILVENNFDGKIYNMVGGIEAWKEAGYPTVKGFMGLPMDESRESMVVGIKG